MNLLVFNLKHVLSLLKYVLEFLKCFSKILLQDNKKSFTCRKQFKVRFAIERGKLESDRHSILPWLYNYINHRRKDFYIIYTEDIIYTKDLASL